MRKTIITFALLLTTIGIMAQKKITQTAGRTQLGEFAPEFATSMTTSSLERYGVATTYCLLETAVL